MSSPDCHLTETLTETFQIQLWDGVPRPRGEAALVDPLAEDEGPAGGPVAPGVRRRHPSQEECLDHRGPLLWLERKLLINI